MATNNEDQTGDKAPDDSGYLPGIPDLVRNRIAQADDEALEVLTPEE